MRVILFGLSFLLLTGLILLLFSDDFFIFVFSKKVWAHRVDSIEMKREASKKFSGVELDLVYNKETGIFDVNHPPAPSINLSVATYLQTDLDTNSGYWFDFKNLEAGNAQSACYKLTSIINSLRLNKKRIVVESPNYPYLKIFAAKGYMISYYLPSLHQMSKDSLFKVVKSIKQSLLTSPNICISSDYKDYKLMKQYFPAQKKLLWWTGRKSSFWSWRKKLSLYRMMSDKTVQVLLVPFEAKSGNR